MPRQAVHMQDSDKLLMYKNLGYLYTKTGNPKMAITYYLKAVDVDQGDPDLYYNLAYLHEKLDQNEKNGMLTIDQWSKLKSEVMHEAETNTGIHTAIQLFDQDIVQWDEAMMMAVLSLVRQNA